MGSDARGYADSERMKTGQRVQCWKRRRGARRRAREACHSSVNEERSLWEPLSSNSPVGQPHTHFTCRKLTQITIHAHSSDARAHNDICTCYRT